MRFQVVDDPEVIKELILAGLLHYRLFGGDFWYRLAPGEFPYPGSSHHTFAVLLED